MGAEESKCKCLYLPAQSGKTRKMEELIVEHKLGELFDPVDINIIISANNRLLVAQTTSRMITDLATESEEGDNNACIKGNVFSWTSGTNDSNITPDHLYAKIALGDIEMVVICAHARRIHYLLQTLKSLCARSTFTKKINIWIDEADNSIKLWSKYEHVLQMPIINQVILVSATFDTVVNKYDTLSVLPYLKTHPECYRGLRDSIRHEVNYVGSAPDFVKHVITNHCDKLVKPGIRAFIPGSLTKSTHNDIADFLHNEHGFIVIVVNGDRKEILVPGIEQPFDLRCHLNVKEFNTQLAKLYKENNWARFPLAIVGFLCVGRGITFQCGPEEGVHDGFLFDYGIIPPIACGAEAYQTMARLFGNVGHLFGYKSVEIYSNSTTFSNVEKKEEIAINIARIVAEQGLSRINKKDLTAAGAPHKRIPVLVPLTDDCFGEIIKVKGEEKKSLIIATIMALVLGDTEFRNVVSTSACIQISAPNIDTKRSYKIHITDVISASLSNSVYSMLDVDKDTKKKTCWQTFIDVKEKRLVVLWQVFH
jgi:hypothetical protein